MGAVVKCTDLRTAAGEQAISMGADYVFPPEFKG